MIAPAFDFLLVNHGSIVVLNALTDAAKTWVEEHLPEDRLTSGPNGTVIEPRYVGHTLLILTFIRWVVGHELLTH